MSAAIVRRAIGRIRSNFDQTPRTEVLAGIAP